MKLGGAHILGQGNPGDQQQGKPLDKDECFQITLPNYFGGRKLFFDEVSQDPDAGLCLPAPGMIQLPKCYEYDDNVVVLHKALTIWSSGVMLEAVQKPVWWGKRGE